MKLFKKFLAFLISLCVIVSLASCAGGYTMDEGGFGADIVGEIPGGGYAPSLEGYEGGVISKIEGDAVTGGEPVEPAEGAGKDTSENGQVKPAGLITAAAWNDNTYYSFWQSLFVKGQEGEEDGKFLNFYEKNRWGFDSTQRVKITVRSNENPVCGAAVVFADDEGEERFAAKTGADGVAYLFPETSKGKITVKSGEYTETVEYDGEDNDLEVALGGAETKRNTIKLMFVVDVTGSMGDELTYLQTELDDVIKRIAAFDDQTRIDLALLFYRDDGDTEKFAYFDFTCVNTEEGLEYQLKNLRKQRVEGGGDYPEAVDEALEMAMGKEWGEDTSTKLIFHVLDAPPHSNRGPQDNYEQRFEKAVRKAAATGIRICPVICSGADTLCEYLMRQAAIYTAGTFVFVTDDSGIGLPHHDPELPNVVVEKLNDLIVRLIKGYHSGEFEAPVSWKE
ncbi:MAG: VWA domain-containing protein [Clostridia bacterium]|nr:VWA domain-containing protein [Clostridia bacterium]